MSNLPQPAALVQVLRTSFTKDSKHYCQCGQYCPKANACLPRTDAVQEPYYTIQRHPAANGCRWSVLMWDPEKEFAYRKTNQTWPSPCQAAHSAAKQALREGRNVRLDRAIDVTNFDLSALEVKVATELYEASDIRFAALASTQAAAMPAWVVSEIQGELVEAA
ncbi:MAG: hypothetical protein U0350_36255 [Caldilineaceae bacterium]